MAMPEGGRAAVTDAAGSEPAPRAGAVIVQPHEGTMLHAFGGAMRMMLGGPETGGVLAVGLETTPPGGGPPPHRHRDDDELFLVLEGHEEFLADGRWTAVGPGGAVYLPRGVPHTFRNAGDAPSRHWVLTTPSGFDRFFAGCAEAFAAPGGPDMERIGGLLAAHGIEILEPPPAH
jgi:quercetin dioxygenase-like cupin family protein